MFLHRVASTPYSDALSFPVEEEWKTINWQEVGKRVREIACGLRALQLNVEDRCAILCNTRVEWLLVDLGILCAGGATTTIYPSSTAEECAFIIGDSGSRVVFAEDNDQIEKLISIRDQIPHVTQVVTIDGRSGHDGWVIRLEDLAERGRQLDDEDGDAYEALIKTITPDKLATLIYTSGTTGRPKGVELTHDCWVFEAEAMDALGFFSPADKQYLWLPMSHSFGKLLEMALIRIGIPTAIDGRIDKIVENLAIIQPTFVAAVPRIFEKVYNKVVSSAREAGGLKHRIFRWAMEVGEEASALKQIGQLPTGRLALKAAVADRLVFSNIKNIFGGKMRFFISGSAPLSHDIAVFFHAADVLILEGYGLTESSAASVVNRPDKFKFGTVGTPLPGVEVMLDPADQEILLRGRGIMRGYYNLADVTTETITDEGWLRTGDIGKIDEGGFLRIVDRKKDLIKTSGGKYVAPQKLEGKLKAICPYVSQVIVHGNRRNFCSMLITLSEEEIEKWTNEAGLGHISGEELSENKHINALIQPFIDQLNSNLSTYETIKKFAILPEDFSVEGGELTPSLKVKRKVVEKKYADVLEGFYAHALESI